VIARIVESDWVLFGVPWIVNKESYEKWLTKQEILRQAAAGRAFSRVREPAGRIRYISRLW
jgi:hypothetical protein